ncbi:hypothetical protein [uncultured Alistipes sp.]|uniref:hypothetical protein n=1 Tax=uncultured Alistipes sp. TaxID=538949 RepID=UPI0026669E06|nr:hypothetical protein [uncultured Alistipes sp.]
MKKNRKTRGMKKKHAPRVRPRTIAPIRARFLVALGCHTENQALSANPWLHLVALTI